MNKLLIIGAGVDKTKGINFPLSNELIIQLNEFLNNNEYGKKVDKTIRNNIPYLRFNYMSFIKDAIYNIISKNEKEIKNMIINLNNEKSLKNKEEKIKLLLIELLEKLSGIKIQSSINNNIFNLLTDIFNNDIKENLDEDMFDININNSFEKILKLIIEKCSEDPKSKIFKIITTNFLDMENLLMEKFLGFYNNKNTDIKKYLYISWTLWSFLVFKEKEISKKYKKKKLPFYSNIPLDYNILSLNYTSFVEKNNKNIIYFHGNLKNYIRIDNRSLLNINNYENIDIIEFLEKQFKTNIHFESNKYVIPAFIPPLKIKPLLSNDYIIKWYESIELINNADIVVIAGYSFNYSDEHFNDIIRNNIKGKLIIINPNINIIKNNISRLIGISEDNFTENEFQKKKSYEYKNIYLVEALADEIDLELIS